MKKISLLMVCFLCMVSNLHASDTYPVTKATTDTYSVSQLIYPTGKDYAYFTVGVNGTLKYSGYQLNITLPTGMEPYYENGNVKVSMVKTTGSCIYPFTTDEDNKESYTHTLSSNVVSSGDIIVACISSSNESFTATVGPLFRVYVKVTPYMKAGTSDVRISKAILDNIVTTSAGTTDVQQWDVTDTSYGIDTGTDRSVDINVSAENKYGTCILPFDAALPTGLSAYTCDAVDGTSLLLTPQTSFKAYTPYIIYAENGCTATVKGTADASKYVETATSGLLMGAITTQQLTSGYVLQNQGSGPCFYKVGSTAYSLAPGKCCLQLSGSAAAIQSYGFKIVTGVSAPSALNTNINAPKYSLGGIRIDNPQEGQIYLQSGKKLINK